MATHYGGAGYLKATSELWGQILDIEGLSRDQIFRRGIEYTTTPEFFSSHRETVERLVAKGFKQRYPYGVPEKVQTTVERELKIARAWLGREMGRPE